MFLGLGVDIVCLLGNVGWVSQMVTYLVCDRLEYRFKVLIGRVRQATKDVKSEV